MACVVLLIQTIWWMVSTPGYCFGVRHTILFSYFHLKKNNFFVSTTETLQLFSEKKYFKSGVRRKFVILFKISAKK